MCNSEVKNEIIFTLTATKNLSGCFKFATTLEEKLEKLKSQKMTETSLFLSFRTCYVICLVSLDVSAKPKQNCTLTSENDAYQSCFCLSWIDAES